MFWFTKVFRICKYDGKEGKVEDGEFLYLLYFV